MVFHLRALRRHERVRAAAHAVARYCDEHADDDARTKDLKCWFFIDELGRIHRLPALEKGLQTARNFGGAIVTGIHAYAKLKEVYGENMAMTLSSLARTKLILGTADRETATWCSDFIGHRQVRDMEEGYTYGYNNARDAVSLTPRKHIEPLCCPTS
jgi:type IV secretory pathway TraG/TraD family ATPase VirD4